MIYVVTSLYAIGCEFSPAVAETRLGIVFSKKVEKGDALRGGRISSFGMGTLAASPLGLRAGIKGDVAAFVSVVAPLIDPLKALGAEDLELHQDVYHNGQCNLDYSATDLKLIESIQLGLTMSVYQDNELLLAVEKMQLTAAAQPRGRDPE